jgi:hemolysin activation/secretion protein
MFYSGASYTINIGLPEKDFTKYTGILQLFVPLIHKFSLSVRTGLSTVAGDPEFYQYVAVGGSQTLRGHRRDRFWGNTAFYNNNDLRYITPFKSYLMNGKAGLSVFWDNGRVWYEGEKSEVWHFGYGAGVLLAPFNKLTVSVMYGISTDNKMWHLRVGKLL